MSKLINEKVNEKVNEKTNEKYKTRNVKQISMREHILKRSMWAGSKSIQTIESYVIQEREPDDHDIKTTSKGNNSIQYIFVLEDLKYPPVLLKLVDEIIVNAIDHHVIYPSLVTRIDVEFDEDGYITVTNNGPGIVVEKTKNLQGSDMYTVQMIFSEFLAGSNLDDKEEKERITGGQNGLGSKIVSVFSDIFIVETTDESNSVFYSQTFKNGLLEIQPPTVIDLKESKDKSKLEKYQMKGHTKIKFLPSYSEFNLTAKKIYKTLYKLIQSRCWQAAAYVSAKVYFNGELIKINSFADVCQMFTEYEIFPTKMINNNTGKFPWDICIGLTDGKERHISFVNGLIVGKGGTHIQYIQKQVVDNLRDKVEKEIKKSGINFNKNIILNNIFIFMRGAIPNPELGGQTKDTVNNPVEQYEGYEIPESHWNKIWQLIQPAIIALFLKKQMGNPKLRANRNKVDVPKYREANYCRDPKRCHDCGLIIAEGDSAIGTATIGLLSKTSEDFNFDYFGTYSIQGVMVNGLKESINSKKNKRNKNTNKVKKPKPKKKNSNVEDIDDGKDVEDIVVTYDKYVPGKKVINNERISSLIKVLGLDFNAAYDFTEKGEKEWATLRYGYVTGLTDQDLDGFNIFGLLCTFFMTYWPALVKRGFIRRINTPLIRAYPKTKKAEFIKEFYTEREAKEWLAEVGEDFAKKNYKFKYYKGLASHVEIKVKKEVSQMFKNINNKICTYVLDEEAIKSMHVYYGDDTQPRKIALSTPVTTDSVVSLEVPLSHHFHIDTKLYQRDNIVRKLLNAIDGFVSSRRKVFYTARKVGQHEVKVSVLASETVSKANYHHGEASLEQTIVRMAQSYKGTRNLPLLRPLGQFGTRSKGFKDYGSGRYMHTTINNHLTDKLFRKEDEFILEYEVEDGERFEPKYYVPIIPYVLCENNMLPATGWAISVYARDIKYIFKNIRDMLSGKIDNCGKLPIWKRGFTGEIRKYKDKNYFVGSYEYDEKENVITITELHPDTYSEAYLKGSEESNKKKKKKKNEDNEKKGITRKELITDYEDNTTNTEVNIKLFLKPEAYDIIKDKYGNEIFDCFEEYLELKQPINDRINLVNERGEVVEYKRYEDVFNDWFNFRKELYGIRVERESILNNLEIEMLKNMQRFSLEHDRYAITSKTPIDMAESIIRKNKYKLFNCTLLENPKYTSVKELILLITSEEHGASYEYLLSMSYRDLTQNAFEKREKRIKELEERQKYLLDETGIFKGAKIWELELNELEKSIEKGIESEWCYDEKEYKFEDDSLDVENKEDKKKPRGTIKSTRGRKQRV